MPVRVYQIEDWTSYKNCNTVTCLSESNEYIFFGTSGGIIPYHKYQHTWHRPYTVSDGMADDYITAVYYDYTTAYLWVAHREGISYLDPTADAWTNSNKQSYDIADDDIFVRFGIQNSTIQVLSSFGEIKSINKLSGYFQGSFDGEADQISWAPSRFDPIPGIETYSINLPYRIDGHGTIYDDNFQEFFVNMFYTDKMLNIYGGIKGLGLLTGDKNVRTLKVRSCGPLNNTISALSLNNNRLIIGNIDNENSRRTGISIYDFNDDEWTYFEDQYIHEFVSPNVFDIIDENFERIWIGTDHGLTVFNNQKNRWKHYSVGQGLRDETVWTIAIDDTTAWIGTPLGLNKIYIPTMNIRRVFLTSDKQHIKIYKIAVDNKYVWIGTDNGLYRVDKLSHIVEHYDVNGSPIKLDVLVNSDVRTICTNDSITVISQFDGLLAFDHFTNTFDKYPQLVDSQVNDMDMSNQYLWLATNNGAYLIRMNDLYKEHYLPQDGLAGYIVTKVKIDDQNVWFATDQGLSNYHWRQYAN